METSPIPFMSFESVIWIYFREVNHQVISIHFCEYGRGLNLGDESITTNDIFNEMWNNFNLRVQRLRFSLSVQVVRFVSINPTRGRYGVAFHTNIIVLTYFWKLNNLTIYVIKSIIISPVYFYEFKIFSYLREDLSEGFLHSQAVRLTDTDMVDNL